MKMEWNWKSNCTVSSMENKKLSKASRKVADNSTCLHPDSFVVNTGKSVDQLWEKVLFRVWSKICQTDSTKICHR